MKLVACEVEIVGLDLKRVSVETKASIVKWKDLPNNESRLTYGFSQQVAAIEHALKNGRCMGSFYHCCKEFM